MPRYKIIIEYDGTDFAGWQKQENALSVQEVIENAIYKFCQAKVTIHGSGRTDSGVHAFGQVAHFDLPQTLDPMVVMNALNYHCKPCLVSVIQVDIVDGNFHARFDAKERHYLYRILNRNSPLTLEKNKAWLIKKHILNINKMIEASRYLLGTHDFSSFRSSICQASTPIKTINNIEIKQKGQEIQILVSAPSFLHHMVRNIVGTLVMVGSDKIPPQYVKDILLAKNRCKAGVKAPAEGLYFLKTDY